MTADRCRPKTRAFPGRRTPARRAVVLAVAVLGLVLALPDLPASAAPPDVWSAPSGGNGNTLDNPGETAITAGTAPRLTRAWTAGTSNASPTAPAVVGGVVYYVHQFWSTTDPSALVAASAATGKTLWQVPISAPDTLWFWDGVTVSGRLALLSFATFPNTGARGGLLAVDTTTHRIAWTRTMPAGSAEEWGWSSHQVYADSTRAYVHLSDYALSAYRLSDGTPLWTTTLPDNLQIGIAVGAGTVYVGDGDVTATGITAYSAATGRKLWTAPGQGTPLVAGGRVYSAATSRLVAINAAGCGKASCPALWTKSFPVAPSRSLMLGAADAGSLYVTYQKVVSANPNADYAAVLTRLSAATGAQQWSTTYGASAGPPVRGGSVVWIDNEYRNAAGAVTDRLVGFSATGTAQAPRVTVPAGQNGVPQSLAVGGGALLEQTNIRPGLVAYRVPAR